MSTYFLIFLGAGLGGVLRQCMSSGASALLNITAPSGILIVNVSGSLLIGLITGWLSLKSSTMWANDARIFLTTGILGGYTTFSTFSLDSVQMIERGEISGALVYVLASVVLSLIGTYLGLSAGRVFA